MLATAADLPPELFDLILDFLPSAVGVRGPPEAKRGKKHMLSLCSLVCKFWASRCRPRLFDSITLRCLADFQTLSSLPAAVRSYIVNLTVEDTKGSVPWTHLVYAFTIQDGLSRDVNLTHTLNGACTPTSVQTLRSLHDSLPRQPPRYIIHCIPLIIRNFRLRSFSDVAQLVRKLPGGMYWHVEFDNVSWITSPGGVPPALGAKNRATCDYAAVKNCEERWPFVWLLVTTRRPQPPSRNELPPGPFLHISEALRLVELVKCITSPTGSKKRLCTNTEFTRSPMSKVIPTKFSLRLSCCDQYSCIPFTTFVCQDGSLNGIRMEFNTDPEQGVRPSHFDWARFDTVCSLCHALEVVELRIDGAETEAAEFGQSMLRRMRSLTRTNKLRFPYYDTTEYKNKTWVDPIGLEEQSTDTA